MTILHCFSYTFINIVGFHKKKKERQLEKERKARLRGARIINTKKKAVERKKRGARTYSCMYVCM